jgi:hypothetical protein
VAALDVHDLVKMKKRTLIIGVFVLLVLGGVGLGYALVRRVQHKREAAYRAQQREATYQNVLQLYSETLKPGMDRKHLEDYLSARGVVFRQMCCILEKSAFADLVKIGEEEERPWYCSEHYVYIAFQFVAAEKQNDFHPHNSDVLKTATIFHQLGGCL